jgi:hypothetical protein
MLSSPGTQDYIGLDVSPIAASTPIRSSLGDPPVSMSDLEKSLAQEECKAIKTKMPTALVDKIGDGAVRNATLRIKVHC